MVKLESAIEVKSRSPEQVFDFMVDFRNENDWDKFNLNAAKLTPGPLGVGTRFRADNVKMGPVDVEITEYARPERYTYRVSGKMGVMRFTASFQRSPSGTRVEMVNELAPRGLYKLMSPLIRTMMRKQQPMHQAKLVRYLESHELRARAD